MTIRPRTVTPAHNPVKNGVAGPGRPVGSKNKITQARLNHAILTGELPHEFLLRVARGEMILWPNRPAGLIGRGLQTVPTPTFPTFEQRVDAAKAAAPYYAPRLSTVEIVRELNDDDLDAIIERAAAEAKISLSFSRTGTPDEGAASITATATVTTVARRTLLPRNGSNQPVQRLTENPVQGHSPMGWEGQREELVGSGSTSQ